MKKILCLVDMDDTSNAAVEYAAELARHSRCELVLMHVLPEPLLHEVDTVSQAGAEHAAKREMRADEKLLNIRALIEDQFKVPCNSILKKDVLNQVNGVKDEINEHIYELVVMGTRGAENLREYFFGIHSDKLIKQLEVPVLIIPHGYIFKAPEQIVYASDYETEDAYVVKKIRQIVSGFSPEVIFLHVSKKPSGISDTLYRAITSELEDELNDSTVRFERIYARETSDGIDGFMKKENRDMLVMLSKSRTLLDKLFGEGIIQHINGIASYPLMIIHSPVVRERKKLISPDIVF